MTDRDNSSEGFLERWSRKKIDAERDAPDRQSAKDDAAPSEDGGPAEAKSSAAGSDREPPFPEFDLASLPSLDSITAATDIRAFLSPGVPKELARAALRRAWVADPAIRDFKGLAEYDWDFTDPTAMVGFGPLEPGYDVQKLVAQIFSDGEKATSADPDVTEPASQQEAHVTEELPASVAPADPAPFPESEPVGVPSETLPAELRVAQADVMQRNNNTASHNNNDNDQGTDRKIRRQHGGALPQ